MLLLKESQVEFKDVINPGGDRSIPVIGVLYQNKLFKHLKSFPKDKLESAQQLTRQLSLDPTVVCLMLEEADRYTIWCQDTKLQSYDASPTDRNITTPIGKIDLKELVREMRDIGGVKIKDRRYRLNVYPRCMVGSEMTTWMVRRFFLAETDAVKLGQRLIDEKLLHHVTDSHPFEDGLFFYRFYWDE
jgi:Domain found in Dishevelled, Egl-10, and Pleckstrin (DEP)